MINVPEIIELCISNVIYLSETGKMYARAALDLEKRIGTVLAPSDSNTSISCVSLTNVPGRKLFVPASGPACKDLKSHHCILTNDRHKAEQTEKSTALLGSSREGRVQGQPLSPNWRDRRANTGNRSPTEPRLGGGNRPSYQRQRGALSTGADTLLEAPRAQAWELKMPGDPGIREARQ